VTSDKLSEALSFYNLNQSEAEFIRHNENITYKITDAGGRYVLRIHTPAEGFASDFYNADIDRVDLIRNELKIISDLKNGTDMTVQTPVRGTDGDLVQTLKGGAPVTLLGWIDGQTVESAGLTPDICWDSGVMMAKMHMFFSQKTALEKRYLRYSYDQTILPRIAERIENAAHDGVVKHEHARTIIKSLGEMRRRFDELDNIHEKHIVHSDLGKSNVIIGADGNLASIDFSLCGYSHFYMDIGSIYGLSHSDERRRRMIGGYKSINNCEIVPRYIEPYFALGVVLFIASQYERAKNWDWFPGNMERWRRDIFQPLADKIDFVII